MDGETGGQATSPFRPLAPAAAATVAGFNVDAEEHREPQNPAAVPNIVPDAIQVPAAPGVPAVGLDLELAHGLPGSNLAPEVAMDLQMVQDEFQDAGHNVTCAITSVGVAGEVLGDPGLSRAMEQQVTGVEVAPMVAEVAATTVAEPSEAAGITRKRR